jgi:nucleotide-binding universal stress UspA family protein
MIDFKRILFPVDLSDQSRAVAPFVRAMARCFGSEVTVLHVAPAETPELEGFIAQELRLTQVFAQTVQGDPAREIVEYAHEHETGLIMLPTHGYGPFRALLLGSVTAKVLHDAQCPVWTGLHAEGMTSHSPDRWKRMACAIDTDERDVRVIQWASGFARAQNLELRLIHAVAGAGGMWTQEGDPSMYDFLFHAARERLATLQTLAGTNLELMLVGGSVGSAVHQAAGAFDADLMIVGRGAGSNAYAIVREAPCPVISV